MKKATSIVAGFLLACVLIVACQKQAVVTPAQEAARIAKLPVAPGMEQFRSIAVTLSSEETALLRKNGRVAFQPAEQPAVSPTDPGIGIDPVVDCNALLQQQYNNVYPAAQAAANKCCCNVYFCIGSDQCGWFLYVVRPTRLCPVPADPADYEAMRAYLAN